MSYDDVAVVQIQRELREARRQRDDERVRHATEWGELVREVERLKAQVETLQQLIEKSKPSDDSTQLAFDFSQ